MNGQTTEILNTIILQAKSGQWVAQDAMVAIAEHWAKGQPAAKGETLRHKSPRIGRNDRCHCGSGKKFKHCHLVLVANGRHSADSTN